MLGFLANFISIKFPVPWRALVKVKIYKKPNQYTFVIFTSFNRLFLRIGYAKSRKILISQAPTLTLCFCLSFCPVSLTYWLLLALNLFWVAWAVSWIRCVPIKDVPFWNTSSVTHNQSFEFVTITKLKRSNRRSPDSDTSPLSVWGIILNGYANGPLIGYGFDVP